MRRRMERLVVAWLAKALALARPRYATRLLVWFFRRHGMNIPGTPNYISAAVWFDGTNYELISLGEGCTISSYVRILTHDWSLHTITGASADPPIGRVAPVSIGAHSFVGTACVIMPGAKIGNQVIIGAGSVVRGTVPDFAIMAGSPAEQIGDVREYAKKRNTEAFALVEKVARARPDGLSVHPPV